MRNRADGGPCQRLRAEMGLYFSPPTHFSFPPACPSRRARARSHNTPPSLHTTHTRGTEPLALRREVAQVQHRARRRLGGRVIAIRHGCCGAVRCEVVLARFVSFSSCRGGSALAFSSSIESDAVDVGSQARTPKAQSDAVAIQEVAGGIPRGARASDRSSPIPAPPRPPPFPARKGLDSRPGMSLFLAVVRVAHAVRCAVSLLLPHCLLRHSAASRPCWCVSNTHTHTHTSTRTPRFPPCLSRAVCAHGIPAPGGVLHAASPPMRPNSQQHSPQPTERR